MQVCKGHITPDKHTAPDEWADAPEDDAELVNAERCGRGHHALRVAQNIVPLKNSPRYLALSYMGRRSRLYLRTKGHSFPHLCWRDSVGRARALHCEGRTAGEPAPTGRHPSTLVGSSGRPGKARSPRT